MTDQNGKPIAVEPPVIGDAELAMYLKKEILERENTQSHREASNKPRHLIVDKEIDKLKALMAMLETPRPKYSGVKWTTDARGGFEVHAYISGDDMKNIRLDVGDANLFHQLVERNKAAPVLNAVAIVFASWEKEKLANEARIAAEIRRQMDNQ